MRQDIKEKWLDYLRSGQYPQTCGVLRDDKGYCCLGVLCDLYECTWNVIPDGESYNSYNFEAVDKGIKEHTFLHFRIALDANLSQEELTTLMEMNDDGRTFLEIADHIEINL